MHKAQAGITLVVSLIMVIVLTLLVVSAIRFANINLKIAGNVQAEVEATAAAQVAIEQTVEKALDAENIGLIAAQPAVTVSTGGKTLTVNVSKPDCIFSRNVSNSELDATNADDMTCFEGTDSDNMIDAAGNQTTRPSACKEQQWDINAKVNDASTGAKVEVVQGVKIRVPAQVSCS